MDADRRVAVVTGANRGIGLEVARQLAARGDTVILTARDADKAETAAAALGNESGKVVAHRLDVTDPTSAAALALFVKDRWQRLDVLINNAGIHYDTFQQARSADLTIVREALETNLLGPGSRPVSRVNSPRRSSAGCGCYAAITSSVSSVAGGAGFSRS
jgi:NAD(P)-dependent dehydrogenase (short-subunit alcohol dehydrogenase family)